MRRKVHRTLADIALHQAASSGDLAAAREAVAHGADVNSQEEEHYTTPLLWACAFGHLDVARFLLDTGADVNYTDENGDTPLHDAIAAGYPEIARLVLERGADIRCLDACGHTPLEATVSYERASSENRKELVDALLEAGCDVNSRNESRNNQTPLMVAAETAADTRNLELLYHLVAKGADIRAIDREGYTAANYAEHGDYAVATQKYLQRLSQ